MNAPLLGGNKPCQVGMIVNDIHAAAVQWGQFLGIEPPAVVSGGEYAVTKTEYMGQPAPEAGCLLAFMDLENIQLELIEPNAAKSTWRDHLEQFGPGIHHYGYQVKDIFASMKDMEKAGFKLTQFGYYGDASGAYAYYDCKAQLGCYVELLCSF